MPVEERAVAPVAARAVEGEAAGPVEEPAEVKAGAPGGGTGGGKGGAPGGTSGRAVGGPSTQTTTTITTIRTMRRGRFCPNCRRPPLPTNRYSSLSLMERVDLRFTTPTTFSVDSSASRKTRMNLSAGLRSVVESRGQAATR